MAGSLIESNTWLNKPNPFSIGTLVVCNFIKHSLPSLPGIKKVVLSLP